MAVMVCDCSPKGNSINSPHSNSFYHRKTRQVTDSDICRDTTLDAFDTYKLNGVFHRDPPLAQRALKYLPEDTLWFVDNKATGVMSSRLSKIDICNLR